MRAGIVTTAECRHRADGEARYRRFDKRIIITAISLRGTVEENLRMGKADATQKRCEEALRRWTCKDDPGAGRTCDAA